MTDLVIVGSVTRPDLRAIRTDLGFWMSLPRIYKIIKAGGDDSVLRRVVGFFESHGFTVRGPAEVAPALVIGEGAYGRVTMSDAARFDFEIGREVVARLAPFDVGQAVVVCDGTVLAIEGAEGTDGMLKRVAEQREGARGGVLVKWPKPGRSCASICRRSGRTRLTGCSCGSRRYCGAGWGDTRGAARRHGGCG